jgi:ABC-type multidrug transport system fused ATPase/permease subunit
MNNDFVLETGSLYSDLMKALGASSRVFSLLDRSPALLAPPDTGTYSLPDIIKGDVELRDVEFSYPSRPGRQVLRGFSLRLEAGSTVALV